MHFVQLNLHLNKKKVPAVSSYFQHSRNLNVQHWVNANKTKLSIRKISSYQVLSAKEKKRYIK